MKSKHTAPPAPATSGAKSDATPATAGDRGGSQDNRLTLVALALALAGIGGAWYTHHAMSSQISQLQQNVSGKLDTAAADVESGMADMSDAFTGKLDALDAKADELSAASTALVNRADALEQGSSDMSSTLENALASIQNNSETIETNTAELIASIEGGNNALSQALQDRSNELAGALESRTTELDSRLETRSDELTGLVEARTGELNDSLQETQMKINRNQRAWLLSEIEYLLRTAVHRVVLAGDTNSAVEALKASKEQLKVLAEVEYLPVQRAISAEITELRSASQPDIEQLIIDIRALSRAASDLRMPGNDTPEADQDAPQSEQPDTEVADTDDNGLGKLAANLLASLKQNVSIKTSSGQQFGSEQDGIFAPSEAESTNAELVRLNLQAAQLSAMRRDQDGFDTHMSNARSRVNSLFDTEHTDTQSFINQLDLLAEISVVPRAEQLGTALRLLVETNQKIGDKS